MSATVDVLLSTPQAISLAVGSLLVSLLDYRAIFWIIAVVMTLGALQIAITLRDQIRADVRSGGTPGGAGPGSRSGRHEGGGPVLGEPSQSCNSELHSDCPSPAWPLVLP